MRHDIERQDIERRNIDRRDLERQNIESCLAYRAALGTKRFERRAGLGIVCPGDASRKGDIVSLFALRRNIERARH